MQEYFPNNNILYIVNGENITNKDILLTEIFNSENSDNLIEKTKDIKGEIIILIEKVEMEEQENDFSKISLEDHFKYYELQGLDKKEIIKKISKDRGVPKNEIYMYFNNKS